MVLAFCIWFFVLKENEVVGIETKSKSSEKRIEHFTEFKVESFNSLPSREITLREAFETSMEQAKEYDKNPQLIYMGSVDDGKVSGKDGKKANWNGMLSLPNAKYRMAIVIENGKLKNYIILDILDDIPFENSEINVDSYEILNLAVKEFEIKPGPVDHPFSRGFHFRLLRDEEQKPFFIIEGQTEFGKSMEIYYNPSNGEYLGRGVQETESSERGEY